MKTKLWLVGILSLVIIFAAGYVSAQGTEQPFARETLVVGPTVVILTAATYGSMATSARLTIEGVIRYTLDGTTPTTTVGHRIADGELRLLGMNQIRKIKMISLLTTCDDCTTVEATYFTK